MHQGSKLLSAPRRCILGVVGHQQQWQRRIRRFAGEHESAVQRRHAETCIGLGSSRRCRATGMRAGLGVLGSVVGRHLSRCLRDNAGKRFLRL